MNISIPVSVGELIDKITILEIKSSFGYNEYIDKELKLLQAIKSKINQDISELEISLADTNKVLWNTEDQIRSKEKKQEFDDEFIQLARNVYINNDKRSQLKKQINEITNSDLMEIKIY